MSMPVETHGSPAILGLLRPGYSPMSQPISGLGVGPGARLMNSAFVVTGLLFVGGPIGSFRQRRGHRPTGPPTRALFEETERWP
jgi:hypothetical membrane protein